MGYRSIITTAGILSLLFVACGQVVSTPGNPATPVDPTATPQLDSVRASAQFQSNLPCPTVVQDESAFSPSDFVVTVNVAVKESSGTCLIGMAIHVDPGGRGVSAGEIDLLFDSSVIRIIQVVHGELLGMDPLVGDEDLDNDQGLVRLALARVGRTDVPTAPGIFARFEGELLSGSRSGEYAIAFGKADPFLTGFVDENFEDILAVEFQEARLFVQ